MNPHLLKFHLKPDHSFNIRYDVVPHFYNSWHYHPEIELVYIIKGSGKQFIGDSVHLFKPGDMLLLGAGLPHLWSSDKKFLRKNSKFKMEAIVMHFMPRCFGDHFFLLPENKALVKLLERSRQAVRIKDNTKLIVADLMKRVLLAKHTERIILLLQILNAIANSKQTKTVCTGGLIFQSNPAESERLNNVFQYTLENFSKQITLQQVAKIAHLSQQSFCRYFRSRIGKTFSRFLIEIRIGNACKLLADTHTGISIICYQCGYNSLSNFNRQFKAITGKTPQAHRKYYQEQHK